MNKFLFSLLFLGVSCLSLQAQDPHRFDAEIDKISQLEVPAEGNTVVFTGSSSIRFWPSVAQDCVNASIVNTGFGGSQMSDLLYFLDQTVLRFKPAKVFIYEGDNDIFAEKTVSEIMSNTQKVVSRIKEEVPGVKIYLISAKPSPARWQFKKQYERLNMAFKGYAFATNDVTFVNVWKPMLNKAGRPFPHIFIQDSLHMTGDGYKIWKESLCKFAQ